MPDNNLQNSLGQLQGTMNRVLDEVKSLRSDFGEHKNEDQNNFSNGRNLSYQVKKEVIDYVDAGFKENNRDRNQHLNEQDIKIDVIDEKVSKMLNDELIKAKAKEIIESQLTSGQKVIAAIGAFLIFCLTIYATFFKK